MPQAERAELTRQVQMMTGVLCAEMEENFFAVTRAHECSTCSVMYPASLPFQGIEKIQEVSEV